MGGNAPAQPHPPAPALYTGLRWSVRGALAGSVAPFYRLRVSYAILARPGGSCAGTVISAGVGAGLRWSWSELRRVREQPWAHTVYVSVRYSPAPAPACAGPRRRSSLFQRRKGTGYVLFA